MSLEMAHKVIVPQKKIMSRSFLNSGTLIVNFLLLSYLVWIEEKKGKKDKQVFSCLLEMAISTTVKTIGTCNMIYPFLHFIFDLAQVSTKSKRWYCTIYLLGQQVQTYIQEGHQYTLFQVQPFGTQNTMAHYSGHETT
jgi:hypothetical protein